MKLLTPKQRETYEFVVNWIAEKRQPPKMREVGEALGVSKVVIYERLNEIVKAGWMVRTPNGKYLPMEAASVSLHEAKQAVRDVANGVIAGKDAEAALDAAAFTVGIHRES